MVEEIRIIVPMLDHPVAWVLISIVGGFAVVRFLLGFYGKLKP